MSTGTVAIMEKLDALNDAVKQRSSSFLDQKQAEFDQYYEEFMERIAETRVRHCNCLFIIIFYFLICREYDCPSCEFNVLKVAGTSGSL